VVLAPGESPIGLRLPLADLDEGKLRRALTVEVKNGSLHVFFPPLELDGFVRLVELVARVTEEAKVEGLVLCGYRPEEATDALTSLGLAADPGVLEVNLPPTSSWRDYDALLTRITSAAAEEGLKTTRLHLNGQVQGTGGGAHLLFGGPTLDENPFFARPDILASVIRYWQAHPCLSYFFSGQYVGPGSQAPRADETLASRLYELETACAGVDHLDEAPDRGFLDRLFRNLMTDSGGNTHRAEICLDKLWNGASPTGMQGLVELRAFETMPDVALQSRAALFARAIVAMLASEPRVDGLRRFDATLHDLYLLPSGLWSDVRTVCEELTAAGLPFDAAWLRDLMAHRFPVLGTLEHEGLEVIVRQALEPWPLMAEVSQGGATSRLVDNSTDRIEIAVADSTSLGAHRVLVNGIELCMREIDGEGTANRRARVGAVRYKSADGWPALHPHISVQSPLTIELIDGTGKVVSAAQYHHWKPDGSVYDGAPREDEEAERRRSERWVVQPDAVGKVCAPIAGVYGQEAHYTLDLRRQNHP
ncbi:MAG: transglutaminase family protein, partial [Myxococcota bacterium]